MKKVGIPCVSAEQADDYRKALALVGLEPVVIIPGLGSRAAACDGLLFIGGRDIDPARYGQQTQPECGEVDRTRDRFELRLLKEALERNIPILGICRGMQMISVALGGTLVQHLPTADQHAVKQDNKAAVVHEVIVEPNSRLARICGLRFGVNSRHHQGVAKPGQLVDASAHCVEDEVVEAIEDSQRRWVVGVQWHPENMMDDPVQRRLFEHFAAAL
ncbi:MAG: gamma-glutamyl-gamma-aminobutyrate hydrolase family protein [Candidatus Doudnabacteria bacterium]|nr:gamma-glutamyl-gamma-aminobutyrate hydrolase family protein [Candidatus Doudnabacteria bacterium]